MRSNEIECSLIKDDIGKENEDDLSTLLTDHEQHLSGQVRRHDQDINL